MKDCEILKYLTGEVSLTPESFTNLYKEAKDEGKQQYKDDLKKRFIKRCAVEDNSYGLGADKQAHCILLDLNREQLCSAIYGLLKHQIDALGINITYEEFCQIIQANISSWYVNIWNLEESLIRIRNEHVEGEVDE